MNVFLSVIGTLLIIATIVVSFIMWVKKKRNIKLSIGLIAIGLFLIVLSNAFVIIPTGYTGVRTTFGQVSEQSVPKGFNFKIPFVQHIELVNNKQQDVTVAAQVWGETKEKTPVYASDVVITFQISEKKSPWIFANVTNSSNLIDEKTVASAIKSAMVELSVSDVTNRSTIEPLVKEKLSVSIDEKYGEDAVTIKKIVINNMDFEDSYNAAIAEKSIALQTQQKQEIENQTAIAKAEADKKVAIANAEAKAEAKRIEAEAEAEANKKIADSLSDAIIDNKAIEKWDGKLPLVSGENGTIIDIGNITGGDE